MYGDLVGCHYLRALQDTIPEHSIFVYEYLANDLLSLGRREMPLAIIKRILRDALRGIAALHDRNTVHTDTKANNMLVDLKETEDRTIVERVQLTELEDAAYVPPGSDIVGGQVGNYMWRSPEAHAQARVNKPSDMFSFGIVCIYAILRSVIFDIGNEKQDEDIEPLAIVLERQISYFTDWDGMEGLLKHLGDNQWCQVFETLRAGFDDENPRRPFSLWKGLDADFKELVGGMTNFDPAKRLTTHEALAHRWFSDV